MDDSDDKSGSFVSNLLLLLSDILLSTAYIPRLNHVSLLFTTHIKMGGHTYS